MKATVEITKDKCSFVYEGTIQEFETFMKYVKWSAPE